MADQNRTLELLIQVRDRVTPVLRKIGAAFLAAGKGIVNGFKGALKLVTNLRVQVLALYANALRLLTKAGWGTLKTIANDLDRIAKLSDRLQFTTESLSGLRYAAKLASIDFGEFSSKLLKLTTNIDKAQRGVDNKREAFAKLGVSIEDLPIGQGGKYDLIEILARVANGFVQIEEPARRTAALVSLFGKSGARLGPLLASGAEGVRAQFEQAQGFGLVFDEGTLQRAERFNDALAQLNFAWQGIRETVFLEVAPAISALLTQLSKWVAENRRSIVDFFKLIGKGAVQTLSLIGDGIVELIALIDSIPGVNLSGPLGAELDEIERKLAEFAAQQASRGRTFRLAPSRENAQLGVDIRKRLADEQRAEFLAGFVTPEIRALEARRAKLIADGFGDGLAGALRAQKAKVSESLAELYASFADTQPPAAPTAVPFAAIPGLEADDADGPFAELLDLSKQRQELLQLTIRMAGYAEQTEAVQAATRDMQRELEQLELGDRLLPLIEQGTLSWGSFKEALDAVAGSYQNTAASQFEVLQQRILEREELLQTQRSLLEMQEQTGLTEASMRLLNEELRVLAASKLLLPLVEAGQLSWESFRAEIDKVRDKLQAAAPAAKGFWDAVGEGAREAIAKFTDFQGAVRDAASSLISGALNGLGNAFADIITGTKSAKEAFKDFALSMLRQIAALIPQLLIIRALSSAFPGLGAPLLAEGGVVDGGMSGSIPLRKFADGGVARRPTFAIFGEAGEEAFVPLKSGAIPVRIDGGNSGQIVFAPQINAVDAPSVKRLLISERDTLMAIWSREMGRTPSYRQVVRSSL